MSNEPLETVSEPDTNIEAETSTETPAEKVTTKSSRHRRVRIALTPLAMAGVIFGAIIGSGAGAALGIFALEYAAKRFANTGEITINTAPNATNPVAAAAAKTAPSTVALLVSSPATVTTGSGFFYDENGYIVTSAHVINHEGVNPTSIDIQVKTWDGDIYDAEIVGWDLSTDVGVLKVTNGAEGIFNAVSWGDSGDLQIGEQVIALGSPYDLLSTVTSGIVSNPDRVIQLTSQAPNKTAPGMEFFGEEVAVEDSLTVRVIQTDAPINPGNSGGPLVDTAGNVIGLVAAIAGGEYSTGLAFAIQGNNVQRIVNNIIETGSSTSGFLGIIVTAAYPEWVSESRPSFIMGAEVFEIGDGTPAQNAGLRVGDIIIRVDGVKVNSASGLSSYVFSKEPGETVEVTYLRDSIEYDLPITLGVRSE